MKENAWRTTLIQQFSRKYDKQAGFIWAMEARVKRGFPDLFVVLADEHESRAIVHHYELKSVTRVPGNLRKLFHPAQVEVMERLHRLGSSVRGLVRVETMPGIVRFLVVEPSVGEWSMEVYDRQAFMFCWLRQRWAIT